MTQNIIKTDNYLLVVDDTEIKIENYYLNNTGNVVEKLKHRLPSSGQWCKKIIAHLPLNGSPVLEGVDLLPPIDDVEKLEYDVNRLAFEEWKSRDERTGTPPYIYGIGFHQGYNKAKEKYKYTEEDLRIAMRFGRLGANLLLTELESPFQTLIESLQQPKYPIAFECEMKQRFEADKTKRDNPLNRVYYVPRTITNIQGKIWQGKYIY